MASRAELAGSRAIIGGTGWYDRNVITNSGDEGITVVGSGVTGHVIQGNFIGLDPDGSTGGGNTDVGLALVTGSGNAIGGTIAGALQLAQAIDPTVPVGSAWLAAGVTKSTTINGQNIVWGDLSLSSAFSASLSVLTIIQ